MKKALQSVIKITLILMCLLPFANASAQTNCQTPIADPASNITSTSAMLTWTIPGGSLAPSFNLIYRKLIPAGSPWVNIVGIGPFYPLSNLTPATPYEFQVSQSCVNPNGTVSISTPSNIVLFTTQPAASNCLTPIGLSTTNIATTSALLSWQPAANSLSYNVRYRIVNTAIWTVLAGPNTTRQLSNLLPSSTYEWQVQSNCSNTPNTSVSPYSTSIFFSTLPNSVGCNAPIAVTESNITNTSALLSWNLTGASSYRIRYKLNTSSTWLFKSSNTNSKTISGLVSGSIYTWQVRSICIDSSGVSVKSPWSAARTFTTLAPTTCPAPQGLSVGNIFATTAYAVWSPAVGASNYQIVYRNTSPGAPDSTWIVISTPLTNIAMPNLTPGSLYECKVRSNCNPSPNTVVLGPWSATITFTTPVLIAVFPNPAAEQVTFNVTSKENDIAKLQIYDFTGNPVRELNSNVNIGENSLNLDVTQLNNGIYTYLFTQGIQTSRGKFIVKH